MCLKLPRPLDEKSGYCLKIMRTTDTPGVFRPYWPAFSIQGGACIAISVEGRVTMRSNGVRATSAVYRLGKTYTVSHRRIAKVENSPQEYPALVHAYRSAAALYRDEADYHKGGPSSESVAIVICRYTGGDLTDGITLTAKSITPLRVISKRDLSQLNYAEGIDGWEKAVKFYLDH